MPRSLIIALTCFVLLAGRAIVPAADIPSVTDIIPQKAAGVIMFRNINEIRERGDRLFQRVGWPFLPSTLFQFAGVELKVNGLVDGDQPCGVMWFHPELVPENKGVANRIGGLYPAAAGFAIKDLGELAKRLGTTREKLEAGEVVESKGQFGYLNRFYRMSKDYLWITSHKELYEHIENRMPLTYAISKARRERMKGADIILAATAKGNRLEKDQMARASQEWLEKHPEMSAEERQAMRELFAVMESASNAVAGFRVQEDGLEVDMDVHFDFRKRKAVTAVLKRFNPTQKASSLRGLPVGNLLLGHAITADGEASLPALTAITQELVKGWRYQRSFLDKGGFLTEAQQLEMLGIFGEVWRQIDGYRLGVYRNADETEHGLIGIVAILDTDDPKGLIQNLRELGGLIDGSGLKPIDGVNELSEEGKAAIKALIADLGDESFKKRQSATSRLILIGAPARPFVDEATKSPDPEVAHRARRINGLIEMEAARLRDKSLKVSLLSNADPKFAFHADQKTDGGTAAAVIEMQTKDFAALNPQLRVMLGRGWRRVHLVPHGKHLVVALGSDTRFVDQTIVNLKDDLPGLAESDENGVFATPLLKERGIEFHVGARRIQRVIAGQRRGDEAEREPEITSFSFTILPESLTFEWRMPVSEIEAIGRLLF